jgi:hypothetical protein
MCFCPHSPPPLKGSHCLAGGSGGGGLEGVANVAAACRADVGACATRSHAAAVTLLRASATARAG